jgi:hypothetical protein
VYYPAGNERTFVITLVLAFLSPPLLFLTKWQFGFSAFLVALSILTVLSIAAIIWFWRKESPVETEEEIGSELLKEYIWNEPKAADQVENNNESASTIENDRIDTAIEAEETLQSQSIEETDPSAKQNKQDVSPEAVDTLMSIDNSAPLPGSDELDEAVIQIAAASAANSSDSGHPANFDASVMTLSPEMEKSPDLEDFFSSKWEDMENREDQTVPMVQAIAKDGELLSDLSSLLEGESVEKQPETTSELHESKDHLSRQEQPSAVLQMASLDEWVGAVDRKSDQTERSKLFQLDELIDIAKKE